MKNGPVPTRYLSAETVIPLLANEDARALLLDGDPSDAGLIASAIALVTGTASPGVVAKARQVLTTSPHRMPPGFAEVMVHEGLDPDGFLAFAITLPGTILTLMETADDATTAEVVMVYAIHVPDHTWIRLASGTEDGAHVNWRKGNIRLPRFPETVMPHIEGRPLRDLISHPALDPLDLTITDVNDDFMEDNRYIEIGTSLHRAHATVVDAMHVRVEAALTRLLANEDDVDGIQLWRMSGDETASILTRWIGRPMGVNPELVLGYDDNALEALLRPLIVEWRAAR